MLLDALPWSDGQVRNCDFGTAMVVGPQLAVSLEPLRAHKYWIRDSRTDTQLNVLSIRRGFWECDFPKVNKGQIVICRFDRSNLIGDRSYDEVAAMDIVIWIRDHWAAASPPLHIRRRRRPPCAAARLRRKIVSGQFDEENPFVLISSVLLVQADKGVLFLVVDRIGDIYRNLPRRADVIVTTVGARHKCQQVCFEGLLLADIAFGARMIEEATRVGQRFEC
ncbi:hypothetical protein F511_27584 [Dorcoceras hygrometricum]|uniref:Uncharacterized protein n=1 Tax=Dorcoceras hygrometricum TaxID=472368 RepID=A0A2Z7BVT1_9LAMI|nr:hypothetical protein F511_27584 [Dorcoceras hygrometricum]